VRLTCGEVLARVARAGSEAGAGMSALVRAQLGGSASVTTTLVRVESPSIVTWIVKFAVWPIRIVCASGDFEMAMWGLITSGVSFTSPHTVLEAALLGSLP